MEWNVSWTNKGRREDLIYYPRCYEAIWTGWKASYGFRIGEIIQKKAGSSKNCTDTVVSKQLL